MPPGAGSATCHQYGRDQPGRDGPGRRPTSRGGLTRGPDRGGHLAHLPERRGQGAQLAYDGEQIGEAPVGVRRAAPTALLADSRSSCRRNHGTLGLHWGSLRPPAEMAMATTHAARTVHHTGSEDSPPAPGAGNVRTTRATGGTRAGAISTSTTAVPIVAPGSPVRVRATHAAANPSSTLPASARPAAAQGSVSPWMAAASMTSAPTASGASSATARIPVRRTGPVGVTSTTRLAGSSRVNAAAAASSAKQTGNSTVAAAGNAAPQPPTTTATPLRPATVGHAPARSTAATITR